MIEDLGLLCLLPLFLFWPGWLSGYWMGTIWLVILIVVHSLIQKKTIWQVLLANTDTMDFISTTNMLLPSWMLVTKLVTWCAITSG